MRQVSGLAAVLLLAATGCGGGKSHARAAGWHVVRVEGPASSSSSGGCFLLLRAHVVGGGSMRYCLKTFHGSPGPNATVTDRGTLTFTLPKGTLRAAVRIEQRFAADGRHATQALHGTLLGGSGSFENAGGTITGGGTDVEYPPGHLTASSLRYRISIRE